MLTRGRNLRPSAEFLSVHLLAGYISAGCNCAHLCDNVDAHCAHVPAKPQPLCTRARETSAHYNYPCHNPTPETFLP